MEHKPIRAEFLPFCKPWIEQEEIDEVVDTIKSGWLSMGPKTQKFEEDFRNYVGAKNAVSINSCTSALFLSLFVLGIKKGDEVITTPFTFGSTASTIIHNGAKPVFCDIEKETYNMDVSQIEKKITEKTKAIIPVHYAGHPVDMDAVMEIAEKHGLKVIEDAAHAIGSEYKKRKIGSIGNTTCFSFYATKNMTTGEGGMITTDDDELAERMRSLRLHGITKDAWKRYSDKGSWYYEISYPGYKLNMTDVQAALGLHQLRKLDRFIGIRSELANYYTKRLSEIPGITTPKTRGDVKHSWHLYPVLVDGVDRSEMINELRKDNIGTSVHFIPVHLHPYYRNLGYNEGDFPNTESVYNRLISLPFFPKMKKEDVDDVVLSIERIKK